MQRIKNYLSYSIKNLSVIDSMKKKIILVTQRVHFDQKTKRKKEIHLTKGECNFLKNVDYKYCNF